MKKEYITVLSLRKIETNLKNTIKKINLTTKNIKIKDKYEYPNS